MRRTRRHAAPELDALATFVAARTGLDFSGSHRNRMEGDLSRRVAQVRVTSPGSYGELLRHDEDELGALVDALTVGETYFFREQHHFELLRNTIVPAHVQAGRGPLRVWSAGCASGEEAYSAAITLAEVGVLGSARILGTDLSPAAVARARAARYAPWSLRRCDADQRRAWFRREGDLFVLDHRYRDEVEIRRANLLDGARTEQFDVVFCRNVLIYLTPPAVRAATAKLHHALAPGGWLLMGASDPILDHPGLSREPHRHAVVYRRTVETAGVTDVRTAAGASSPRRPAPAVSTPPATAPGRATASVTAGGRDAGVHTREHHAAITTRLPSGRPPSGRLVSRAARIRELGGRGALDDARELADQAIAESPLDAEFRYLAATVHLDAGRLHDAVQAAAAAVYLEPGSVAAHVMLGTIHQRMGNSTQAEISYRNALGLLARMQPEEEVALADGDTAASLTDAVARLLSESRDDPAR